MLRRVLGAAGVMAVVMLSGCGTSSSGAADAVPADRTPSKASYSTDPVDPMRAKLEAYAAAVQRGTKSAIGPSVRKKFSTIRVEPVSPSGIKYVYTFKSPVDVSRGRTYLKT
jgi:hypothetical protein